jgi:hypothetical protein
MGGGKEHINIQSTEWERTETEVRERENET